MRYRLNSPVVEWEKRLEDTSGIELLQFERKLHFLGLWGRGSRNWGRGKKKKTTERVGVSHVGFRWSQD